MQFRAVKRLAMDAPYWSRTSTARLMVPPEVFGAPRLVR